MAKKKKLTKAERKEARLRKGKQWLLTYTGSPKKMNKHYRERFHVDVATAAKDLQELGVNYTPVSYTHLSADKAFVNRRFIVSKAALEDDGIDHMSMGRVLGNEDSKVVSYPVSSNVFKVAGGCLLYTSRCV